MSYDLNDLTRLFRVKVVICECGCWRWEGAVDSSGYGSFWLRGKTHIAHRYAYERLVGAIDEEMTLDHLSCTSHRCVNPAHLQPITRSANSERANETRYRGLKFDSEGQPITATKCEPCASFGKPTTNTPTESEPQ